MTASDEEISRRIQKRQRKGNLSNIDSLEKYQWAKGIFNRIEFVPVTEINTVDSDHSNYVFEIMKDLE